MTKEEKMLIGNLMKNIKLISFLGVTLLGISVMALAGDSPVIEKLNIDKLSRARVDRFPAGWRTWPFRRGKAKQVYKVKQEGNSRFIHAYDDKDISVQTMRNFYWPIDKYPYLSWQWRARVLPEGARENIDTKNDSACGVYVVVGKAKGHALKYVWSTQLPVGKIVTRRKGKLKIKVADTGKANLNQWRRHTVKVPQDYQQMFGRELKKNPSGIAILTDGNATHTASSCDYKNFVISKGPLK